MAETSEKLLHLQCLSKYNFIIKMLKNYSQTYFMSQLFYATKICHNLQMAYKPQLLSVTDLDWDCMSSGILVLL